MELPDYLVDADRKSVLFLVAGLVIGSSVVFLATADNVVSGQEAGEQLVSTLEAQSGQDLELVSVNESNGLYEIGVRNGNQTSTFFMTKDGQTVTQSAVNFPQFRRATNRRASFTSCLSDRNVTIYGNSSQQETALQVQLLGGQSFAQPVYKDVQNQQVLVEALQRNVTRIPSTYFNGSVAGGVQTVSSLENLTACSFNSG